MIAAQGIIELYSVSFVLTLGRAGIVRKMGLSRLDVVAFEDGIQYFGICATLGRAACVVHSQFNRPVIPGAWVLFD